MSDIFFFLNKIGKTKTEKQLYLLIKICLFSLELGVEGGVGRVVGGGGCAGLGSNKEFHRIKTS